MFLNPLIPINTSFNLYTFLNPEWHATLCHYLRKTASYIDPSNLKLMPPNSRRTLMPCKTGKVPGRCHLILTSVRYYASPTSVIRSWQIIISTANNFKSSTTPNTSALGQNKIYVCLLSHVKKNLGSVGRD